MYKLLCLLLYPIKKEKKGRRRKEEEEEEEESVPKTALYFPLKNTHTKTVTMKRCLAYLALIYQGPACTVSK